MAEHTKIQWCDHTFNPWVGCSKVNEGCKNCYAENLMDTRYGRVEWGPNGTRSLTKTWDDPLRWNREARQSGKGRKVFCASLADVFEDWQGPIQDSRGRRLFLNPHANWTGRHTTHTRMVVPDGTGRPLTMDDLRANLFRLIDCCPNLHWLLLTKRPENVRQMWRGPNRRNVWLGTSVANQANADEWIPRLLANRGLSKYLFLSVEPQIGCIDLSRFLYPQPSVDWVIVGGESRQGRAAARKFSTEWARLIVRQCAEASVPCFVKQLGSDVEDAGRHSLRLADQHGGDWGEWPEDLRVRECPETFFPQLVTDDDPVGVR